MFTMRQIRVAALSAFLALPLWSLCSQDVAQKVPAQPPLTLDLYDFGAKGDGKTDDSEALLRALDEACSTEGGKIPTRVVTIRAGTYRICKTITLEPRHNGLVINALGMGTGNRARLLWDGDKGGTLLQTWSVNGLVIRDLVLDGGGKAGILFRVNSTDPKSKDKTYFSKYGQNASTGYYIERVKFCNAETGVSLSDDSYINSDCSTYMNPMFESLKTAFHSHSEQNLDLMILRPDVGWCDTAFKFEGGGYVYANLVNCHHVDVVFDISGCGINSGVFELSTVRPEQGGKTKGRRPVTLVASGEVNVKMTGLQTTCCGVLGEGADPQTPVFILGPSANVSVESSMICGKIAELKGNPKDVPTWIQFDNCRFRALSDPRKDIEADEASGYEFRNCVVTRDEVSGGEYRILASDMIPILTKYPRQAYRSK